MLSGAGALREAAARGSPEPAAGGSPEPAAGDAPVAAGGGAVAAFFAGGDWLVAASVALLPMEAAGGWVRGRKEPKPLMTTTVQAAREALEKRSKLNAALRN